MAIIRHSLMKDQTYKDNDMSKSTLKNIIAQHKKSELKVDEVSIATAETIIENTEVKDGNVTSNGEPWKKALADNGVTVDEAKRVNKAVVQTTEAATIAVGALGQEHCKKEGEDITLTVPLEGLGEITVSHQYSKSVGTGAVKKGETPQRTTVRNFTNSPRVIIKGTAGTKNGKLRRANRTE